MALFPESVCLVRASVMLTLAITSHVRLGQDQAAAVACASCQAIRGCENPSNFCEHQLAYTCLGQGSSFFHYTARRSAVSVSHNNPVGKPDEQQPEAIKEINDQAQAKSEAASVPIPQDQALDSRNDSVGIDPGLGETLDPKQDHKMLPAKKVNGQRDSTDTPCSTRAQSDCQQEEKLERYEFAAPAYFPLTDYDSFGMQYQRPGLVILEGMALTFEPCSSQYELTFEYEVPAIPVELRLQLMVYRSPYPANTEHTNNWFTITVPVTRLEAGRSDSPSVKQARIQGNSVALKHLYQSATEQPPISLQIKRRGTARFGHGFDRVDTATTRH